MGLPLLIAGIVVCIFLSAFFSASELSYSSCNKVRLEHAAGEGDKQAEKALSVAEQYDDALSTILVGNNLVNIAASSLGSVAVILFLGEHYAWASTAIITVLVIIFGETIPKITAQKNANRFSPFGVSTSISPRSPAIMRRFISSTLLWRLSWISLTRLLMTLLLSTG